MGQTMHANLGDHAKMARRKVTQAPIASGAKRGRKAPPPGETARDRFVRIGNNRMARVLQSIRLLGNLASTHYAWTPEDLERMHQAIVDQVDRTFARFEAKEPGASDDSFKLDS